VARFHYASLFLTACVLSPASYVLTEWLRGWTLSGFPWLSVGYGQIDGPLAAWAPIGGVYAVSLVTAVLGGIVLTLVSGTARDRALAAMVAVVVALSTWALSGRDWTVPEGKPLRVALVQGAIPQLLKWEPGEQRATLELYASLTVALHERDLVVWPEAAIPVPDDLVPEYLSDLARLAESRNWQLLVGILTHDPQSDEYRNSLLALGRERGVYHKRHLVPFGEYFPVPDMVRSWMRLMNLPYSDIAPGKPQQPLLRAHGVGLAPTICYEDAFGAEQLGFLPAAGLLVNVSNDAWFGDTIAPHQHLQMARMRSLETGRYLVRSTNTGITAIIDHRGNVRATIPSFEPEVLTGVAQPYSGATPYVRAGNYPVVLTCLLILVLATAAQLAQGRHRAD
jgi:apolipoprotein N-acyltransferase